MSPARKTSSRAGGSAKSARKPAAGKAAKKTTGKKTARKSAAKKTAAAQPAPRKTPKKTPKKTTKSTTKATAKKAAAQKKKTTVKRAAQGRAAAPKKTTAARKQPAPKAAPSAPARRTRPAKFDKGQLAAIRKELLSERTDLERQLAEIEAASSDATRSDRAGEIGADSDFADAGSATFERERELSIQNNMRDLIDQIGRALDRIDEGLYGICERCGRPIDAARLKALPHALLCMDCKRREERAR